MEFAIFEMSKNRSSGQFSKVFGRGGDNKSPVSDIFIVRITRALNGNYCQFPGKFQTRRRKLLAKIYFLSLDLVLNTISDNNNLATWSKSH